MQQTPESGHNHHKPKKPKKPINSPREAFYHGKKKRHLAEKPLISDELTVLGSAHEEVTRVKHPEKPVSRSEYPTVLRSAHEEKTRLSHGQTEIIEVPDEDVISYVSQVVQEKAKRASLPPMEIDLALATQDKTSPETPPSIAHSKDVSEPQISVSWEEDVDISEFIASESIILLDFITKTKLEGNDAYVLYDFLQNYPQNPKLWQFIQKVAPKPIDYDLFLHNFELLSPDFIQSVLVNGSFEERTIDPETNQEKSIYLVSMSKLAEGGIGVVTNSFYCEEDNLKLEAVLVKTALDNLDAQAVFPDEIKMARRVKTAIDKNPDDPRTKHIVYPKYIGQNFIVMPFIVGPNGRSAPLNKLSPSSPSATRHWANQMIGAIKGNTFLTEQGIINVDFKPGNILMTDQGGVLIDWGGFLQKHQVKSGAAEIWSEPKTATMYPFLRNEVAKLNTDEEWEKMRGNVPRTAVYSSLHLLAMEMQDQISAGSVHKFTLYRIIERHLVRRYRIENVPEFNHLNELEKLYQEPLHLDVAKLPAADQLLYNLYLKLNQAHFHPYHFREDDVKKGMDPEYISNLEIIAALEEIANTKE